MHFIVVHSLISAVQETEVFEHNNRLVRLGSTQGDQG